MAPRSLSSSTICFRSTSPHDKDLPDAAYTWDRVSEAGPSKGTAEKTITIPSAKRDGYQFAGWTITYVDPVSGEAPVTTDLAGNTFIMPMAPVLVTAKWAQYMDVVIEYFKRGDVHPLVLPRLIALSRAPPTPCRSTRSQPSRQLI